MSAPALDSGITATMADANQKVESSLALKSWTEVCDEHPLSQFAAQLPEILIEAGHSEMYGVDLHAPQEG